MENTYEYRTNHFPSPEKSMKVTRSLICAISLGKFEPQLSHHTRPLFASRYEEPLASRSKRNAFEIASPLTSLDLLLKAKRNVPVSPTAISVNNHPRIISATSAKGHGPNLLRADMLVEFIAVSNPL